MMSFLLGVPALLQCVPVMSFDGFFHGIKQCSSKWQNTNCKHIKIKFIKIILQALIIKQELIYITVKIGTNKKLQCIHPYCSGSRWPQFSNFGPLPYGLLVFQYKKQWPSICKMFFMGRSFFKETDSLNSKLRASISSSFPQTYHSQSWTIFAPFIFYRISIAWTPFPVQIPSGRSSFKKVLTEVNWIKRKFKVLRIWQKTLNTSASHPGTAHVHTSNTRSKSIRPF